MGNDDLLTGLVLGTAIGAGTTFVFMSLTQQMDQIQEQQKQQAQPSVTQFQRGPDGEITGVFERPAQFNAGMQF